MTGGNPIGRGFQATPGADNTSNDGVHFTHPILQFVTAVSRIVQGGSGREGGKGSNLFLSHYEICGGVLGFASLLSRRTILLTVE